MYLTCNTIQYCTVLYCRPILLIFACVNPPQLEKWGGTKPTLKSVAPSLSSLAASQAACAGAAPRILKWGGDKTGFASGASEKKNLYPPLFQLRGVHASEYQYMYCTLNTRVFKFNVQPKADGSQLNLPRGSLVYHTDVL